MRLLPFLLSTIVFTLMWVAILSNFALKEKEFAQIQACLVPLYNEEIYLGVAQ